MTEFAEGVLRTFDWQGLRFGVLICNDLWATPGFTTMSNPYLAWRLKQMGAQLILHAINSGRDLRHRPWHEACTAMWAKAVQLPILQVNAAPADGQPLNAPSGLIGPDGTRLVSVPDCTEEYFLCDLL
jgi:predicted amidohydrolase